MQGFEINANFDKKVKNKKLRKTGLCADLALNRHICESLEFMSTKIKQEGALHAIIICNYMVGTTCLEYVLLVNVSGASYMLARLKKYCGN